MNVMNVDEMMNIMNVDFYDKEDEGVCNVIGCN